MALYSYRALDTDGKSQKGTLNAASVQEAKAMLKSRKVYPLEVRSTQSAGFNPLNFKISLRRSGVSPRVLANFCRQFSTLLEATIPYDAALAMILQQTGDLKFKSVLSDIRANVEEGRLLADAMARHPDYFAQMTVNMVRSGESSGTLGLIMGRLADYFEELARIRNKVTSALLYPAFMTIFGLTMIIFMVTVIIPKITTILITFGAELPLTTRMLIGFSDLITGYWWLLLIVGAGGSLWGARFLRTEKGKLARDRAELALPIWNKLRRKIILQRFMQTLATLLQSQVELKSALSIASDVMENRVYRQEMVRVIEDVQSRGIPLAVALRRSDLFPDDVCQMIDIGEKTANLDTMLENVSKRLSLEITNSIDAAMALLEPVIILAMGVVIGFIVISILLPMLQMNELVR